MQAKGYDNWSSATDAFGFSALPAGYFNYYAVTKGFRDVGSYAFFWSATGDYSNAYRWRLYASDADLDLNAADVGFSVRCLKD